MATRAENRAAVISTKAGTELYLRYLGMLRVLGEAAAFVPGDFADMREQIDMALRDAEAAYPLKVVQVLARYDVYSDNTEQVVKLEADRKEDHRG